MEEASVHKKLTNPEFKRLPQLHIVNKREYLKIVVLVVLVALALRVSGNDRLKKV
jgi:hypothetical protein